MTRTTPFNHMLFTVLLVISQCYAHEKIHDFTKIPKIHTIVVKYFQQGCFGYYGYHFEFHFGNTPNVKIIKRNPIFSKKTGQWIDKKSNIPERTILLSNDDLIALYTLLELYRSASKPRGDGILQFSTSFEVVEFIEFANSRIIAKEKFENHTGNTNPNPRPEGFVSFNDLIERAGIQ